MLGREIQNGQHVISDGKVKVDLNQDTNHGIFLVTLSSKEKNHVFRAVKRYLTYIPYLRYGIK